MPQNKTAGRDGSRGRRSCYPSTNVVLCLDDARRDEEDQFLVRGVDGCVLEQVAQAGMLPSNGTCEMLIELLVWMTPPITTVPPSVTSTWVVACCVIKCRVALHRAAEVRRGVLHVHVQEDRAFRRDLRNHRQPQERVHVGHGWRSAQLRLGHDRHADALANQSLDVVLRDDSRTRQNLQQAARLGHRQDGVDTHVVAGVDEGQAAGRAGDRQVREQRNLRSRASVAGAAALSDVAGVQAIDRGSE